MKSMNPHLVFPGCAREALQFYQAVFGGEAEFFEVGDREHTGLPKDAIFHSELRGDNFRLMAADAAPGEGSTGGDRVRLHIECGDKDELERTFAALSEGGAVHCEICAAFGGLFAMTTDRYGISWFLTLPD